MTDTPALTVPQIRAKKAELERKVYILLNDFEAETGTTIQRVSLVHERRATGRGVLTEVRADVDLGL